MIFATPPHDNLGAPGPGSSGTGLRPWGGDLEFETWGSEKDAVGFVLAGGQSRRMGTDKALIEFRGRPLIAYALDLVRAAGLPVFIAGARSALDSFAPVIPDSRTDAGPLEGICAALESLKGGSIDLAVRASGSRAPYAVFLPVDLPLLPPALLLYLLHHARITGRAVTLPSVNGFPQTFPVVLSLACLPGLEHECKSGRRGCYAAFQSAAATLEEPVSVLRTEVLVQSRKITHPVALPVTHWFLNVNDLADLRRATSISAGRVS
ncbi:MAG TPA: NTP transferase domain-containing protein [Terracidiphilus sp.]